MNTIREANATSALERIAEALTEAQQLALVMAWRQASGGSAVQVAANERTIGALLKGAGPLIEEKAGRRVLTGLGEDVAGYLSATHTFAIPDFGSLLPEGPKSR